MSVRPTESSLAKVGVTLVDADNLALRCNTCGATYTPSMNPGGRLHRGWWKCPNNPEHTVEEK